MRYYLCYLLLLLGSATGVAADEYTKCTNHYFKNGKVSTSECYDKDHRFGKARAFDRTGRLIYEKEIRRIGGSASVEFTYYDNGAVRKAHWHSAPDGGIQWYNTTTTFSEDGKVTGETENNYDHSPGRTIQQYPEHTVKPRQEPTKTVRCAVIYSSEFWFTNTTYFAVVVAVTRGTEHFTITLKPGETMNGGQMILAEQFDSPDKYYSFSVSPEDKNRKERPVIIPSDRKQQQEGKTVRRYYFDVRRII